MDINDLHTQALNGAVDAEEDLFRQLSDRFTDFVRLRIEDPEARRETVQETLAVIAERYKDLNIETSFAAWAYGVLENKLKQYYQSSSVRRSRMTGIEAARHQAAAPVGDASIRRKLLECLREAVRKNKRYARILNLHYQGYTMEEICSRMGLTRNAAYLLLSRGRQQLRECMEKKGSGK